jgi:hypothetical protein
MRSVHLVLAVFLLLFRQFARAEAPTLQRLIVRATADRVQVETAISRGEGVAGLELQARIVHAATGQTLWSGSLGQPGSRTVSGLKPDLWAPNHPALYNLTVTVVKDGQSVTNQTVRFGFRSFETKGGQFYLNGAPIFLKGIAINPPGRTVPTETGESRKFAEDYVRLLKDKNVNIIRMTHDSQVWFDVCDELGMMVYQGQYGSPLGSESGKQGPPVDFKVSLERYQRLFETYSRHPSILIYVLANELPVSGTRGQAFHDYLTKLHGELKAWDPTHVYIANAGYGEGREGDVCDVHRYWGWYYNTFLTYYNLRDRNLFSTGSGSILKGRGALDEEDNSAHRSAAGLSRSSDETSTAPRVSSSRSKKAIGRAAAEASLTPEQPLTFSECVGNFTGPTGEYNIIMRKQLGAQLNWTGHSPNQRDDALEYQGFMAQEAAETFRRLRPMNPNLSGLMPFSIFFYNWSGITNFSQMKAKPALDALATAYQPVLLSWELWTPHVYSGSALRPVAHVINDSEDALGLTNTTLQCQLRTKEGRAIVRLAAVHLPKIPYYKTWSSRLQLDIPADLPTGEYILSGLVMAKNGRTLSRNECTVFVANRRWSTEPRGPLEQDVTLYDPSGKTARALRDLGLPFRQITDLRKGVPVAGVLVIGEEAWNSAAADEAAKLKACIRNGGRILLLKQDPAKFDSSWLPAPIAFFSASANSPTYPPASRPFNGNMHVNPERPDHPVFTWLNRRHFDVWSDYTDWEQTRPGFPQVYPVTAGFKLKDADSLARVAVLADYDRGLEGIALCEMFDGRGSVIVSAFDIIQRAGLDPVADRFLANLVRYAASQKNHDVHPLIDQPIEWGNYASERGVINGPLNGLVVNATWVRPPTNLSAQPLTQDEGAWNTRPGDQFSPHGRSPLGPYGYSTGSGLRDLKPDSETGAGIFWARIAPGKKTVATLVENPTSKAAELEVSVNDGPDTKTEIPAGTTVTVSAPLPGDATKVGVKFVGSKKLVLLKTTFE